MLFWDVFDFMFLSVFFVIYVFKTHAPNMIFLAFYFLCGAYLCYNHYELYKVPFLNFTTSSYIHESMFRMIMFLCRFLFLSSFMFRSCFVVSYY
jgi:hypothetical protein